MTKKKGFFSKFKKPLSKKSGDSEDEFEEELDGEELEDELDDEFEDASDRTGNISLNQSEDEDIDYIEVDEDSNELVELESDTADSGSGFFSKIKNKLSKKNTHEDSYEDDEYEDEEEYVDEVSDFEEQSTGIFSKIKNKLSPKSEQDLDEESEDLEDDELEDPEEVVEFEKESTGIFNKIKGKLAKSPESGQGIDNQDEDDYEDEDDGELLSASDSTNTEIKINAPVNSEDHDLQEANLEDATEGTEENIVINTQEEISVNENEDEEDELEELIDEDDDFDESFNDDEYQIPKKKPILPGVDNLLSRFKRDSSGGSKFNLPFKKESKPSTSSIGKDELILSLLGTKGRERNHRIFIYLLTITIFYNVGKFTGLILGGESPKRPQSSFNTPKRYLPRKDIVAIERNNIFNALESEEAKVVEDKKPERKEPEIKVCLDADKKSGLSIKLLHTVVLQDSVKSVASVSKRGKIISIREGEKIDNLAEIGRIENQRLVFKNLTSKKCEFIESDGSKEKSKFPKPKVYSASKAKDIKKSFNRDNIQVEGNKFKIKKTLRDELLSNVGEILTQARAIPIKNPDGTLSFKMTEIVPGSIFSQLNIKDGDVITELNGRKIRNYNELMGMFGKIKQNDSYEINLNRNGARETLNYNFTD
ncbi:MAG: hypothetical protein CME69_11025 [Halobacteriovorax sp.]|nr:hypothetical protein [Halobacteriovorax sp.]